MKRKYHQNKEVVSDREPLWATTKKQLLYMLRVLLLFNGTQQLKKSIRDTLVRLQTALSGAEPIVLVHQGIGYAICVSLTTSLITVVCSLIWH